jgi:hypothetical protein
VGLVADGAGQMTKAEFYNKALLAVIPPVTQAYILKDNLPFLEGWANLDDENDAGSDAMETIAEIEDLLAAKMTAY